MPLPNGWYGWSQPIGYGHPALRSGALSSLRGIRIAQPPVPRKDEPVVNDFPKDDGSTPPNPNQPPPGSSTGGSGTSNQNTKFLYEGGTINPYAGYADFNDPVAIPTSIYDFEAMGLTKPGTRVMTKDRTFNVQGQMTGDREFSTVSYTPEFLKDVVEAAAMQRVRGGQWGNLPPLSRIQAMQGTLDDIRGMGAGALTNRFSKFSGRSSTPAVWPAVEAARRRRATPMGGV